MVGALASTDQDRAGCHQWRSACKTTASPGDEQRWRDGSTGDGSRPSDRRPYRCFIEQLPTKGLCSCLIVPSVMRLSLMRARCSSGQMVPTSSNTRVVTRQTVNYFGPFVKGARKSMARRYRGSLMYYAGIM